MKNKFFAKFDLHKNRLPIYQNAYYWFILPLAIIFIALVCGTVYSTEGNKYDGFANVGIDFKGGTVLTVEMTGADMQGSNYDEHVKMIEEAVAESGAKAGMAQKSGDNAIIVKYQNSIGGTDYNSADKTEEMIAINDTIEKTVVNKFVEKYGTSVRVTANAEMTNATASSDLIKKACLSVGIAILLMLIYTAIRFDFFSGIAALCAQLTDVIVMLACVIIFRIQINSSLIAGIITIIAYSINNTIIVFDRVRENMAPYKHKKEKVDIKGVLNGSVSACVSRALLTSATTLITITILACVGVQTLTDFALPIIFGILSGLYSSIFIAPSIWGLLMKAKQNNVRKTKKARARR